MGQKKKHYKSCKAGDGKIDAVYAYRDRRNKKRDFKSLWIQRINAGVRAEGMTYSKFVNGLSKCGITIDRKILAEIAYDSPEAFKTIVQKAQSALN